MTQPSIHAPDVRFYLPPGPPIPPKRWQRRYKWLIRIGTVVVVVAALVVAAVALVAGFASRSTIAALGGVTVDCGTRAAAGTVPVAFGDPVAIYDADRVAPGDEPMATTSLDRLKVLAGDTCIAEFAVDELAVERAYVVRIGKDYRRVVTSESLKAGYLFE